MCHKTKPNQLFDECTDFEEAINIPKRALIQEKVRYTFGMHLCCLVARTTWLPVLWKYKRHRISQARQTEAEAEIQLWKDVDL